MGMFLVGLLMFGLVSGAGYNIVVPTTTTDDSSSSGGGGGGSSAGGLTYAVNANQFLVGYSKEIGVNDRFKITVADELHYVKLTGLTNTTASINVSSDTQQATLVIGDVRKFDVNSDNNYDLSVKLESINSTSSKATLVIISINEQVTEEIAAMEENKESEAVDVMESEKEIGYNLWWIWVIIIVIVIGIIGAIIIYFKKK